MWASFFVSVVSGLVNVNANSNGNVNAEVDDDDNCNVYNFGGFGRSESGGDETGPWGESQ